MNLRVKSSFSRNIFLTFTLCALLPLLIMALASYRTISRSLMSHIKNKLVAISAGKQTLLADRINDISGFVEEKASGAAPSEAFEKYYAAFKTGGSKSREYEQLDSFYHRTFKKYFEANKYINNMFFISKEGDIIFSMLHESDLGKNIRDPILKNTALAGVFDTVETCLSVEVSRFELYGPSGKPAFFIAAPLFGKNKLLGALVFQIKPEALYEIANDYNGLPGAGEIIYAQLTNKELVVVAPARFWPDAEFKLRYKLTPDSDLYIQRGCEGKAGVGFAVDYRGIAVLARWEYVAMLNLGMSVKVDEAATLKPINDLRNLYIGLFFLLVSVLVGMSILIAHGIANPIEKIRDGLKIIGKGNLDYKISLGRHDEIGELSDTIDSMTSDLKAVTASRDELSIEIEARKKAEAELTQTMRRLSDYAREWANTFDAMSDLIIILSPDYIITNVNRATEELLQKPKRELIGRKCHEIFHNRQSPIDECLLCESVMDKSKKYSEIYEPQFSKWLAVSIAPVLDENNNVKSVIHVIRDITLQRKLQDIVKESEERYRSLVSNLPVGVYRNTPGPEGVFLEANPAIVDMFEASSKEEFMKMKVRDLYADSAARAKFSEKVAKAGFVKNEEIKLRTLKGKEFWGSVTAMVSKDEKGGLHFDGAIEDITEQKKLQEMKDMFISMVSHEMRTPLAAIREGISIMQDGSAGPVNEIQKDFLTTCVRNVDRLARLINNFLDWRRITDAKLEIVKSREDVNGVIMEALKVMTPLAESKSLKLIAETNAGIPLIEFDKDRILQVLINLINNAIKFTKKGKITVVSQLAEKEITVSVIDEGIGIKQEEMYKLFKTFSQIGPLETRQTGSTGLGLVISKGIIELHQGRIWAESAEGQGTKFSFTLPVV